MLSQMHLKINVIYLVFYLQKISTEHGDQVKRYLYWLEGDDK